MLDANSRKLRRVLYVTDLNPAKKFGSLDELIFVLACAFKERHGLFLPVFREPLSDEGAERYETAGLPTETLNLYSFKLSTLHRLLHLIRQHEIELIDWNFYSPTNPYMLALMILAPKLKHYYTDHNSRPSHPGAARGGVKTMVKKMLLKRYSKVLCITDFLLENLERQNIWSNLSRCYFFINTNRFQPDPSVRNEVREQLAASGRFVILTVGSLIPEKGMEVVIRALAELPESALLWIVGDGREAERLRALSDELSVSSRVRFFGRQQDVSPYMKAADCFVCPSLWAEAMGFVNLEALATQLPVIASNIGGIPELLDDGETGFLFPPGDHRQLADKINRLMRDPAAHQRMSLNARQSALTRFSAESMLPGYLDLYRSTAA
jgi:glycosyltransferase involved in cell wall biosynthesis